VGRDSKALPSILIVAIGFLFVSWWSAALADKGSLQLPKQVNSNIELILQNELGATEPAKMLQVYVGGTDACCENKLPIAGRYLIEGKKITFVPAFDFVEGKAYTAMTHGTELVNNQRTEQELTEFVIGNTNGVEKPQVLAIYPSGNEIPENTLRFYIHFSVPMKPHMSSRFIKLLDSEGEPDTEAFMEFKQELWSEDRKRLTLLVDPGRIKRGVAQNMSIGPALLEGSRFSIVVEPGWQTANGAVQTAKFENTFTVTQAQRTRPDTVLWTIETPGTLTNDPLLIKFDRAFDHALLQSGITVLDKYGRPVPGMSSIDNHEKEWRFIPENVWSSAQVRLVVDTLMEDVAGNNFRELLDHSIESKTQEANKRIITVELKHSPNQSQANNAE